jgi:hypothetical protein
MLFNALILIIIPSLIGASCTITPLDLVLSPVEVPILQSGIAIYNSPIFSATFAITSCVPLTITVAGTLSYGGATYPRAEITVPINYDGIVDVWYVVSLITAISTFAVELDWTLSFAGDPGYTPSGVFSR